VGEDGYIVKLGYNQPTETAARDKMAQYDQTLTKLGLKTGKLLARKVKK